VVSAADLAVTPEETSMLSAVAAAPPGL
jgi:hypothetical protein